MDHNSLEELLDHRMADQLRPNARQPHRLLLERFEEKERSVLTAAVAEEHHEVRAGRALQFLEHRLSKRSGKSSVR